jgi:hypothetical protein
VSARYGYEEVETGYRVWLGGLENLPWSLSQTRAEYLAWRAKKETLLSALDLNGYRQFTEITPDLISDEALLKSMHTQRAKSLYVPAKARAESAQWLALNNDSASRRASDAPHRRKQNK